MGPYQVLYFLQIIKWYDSTVVNNALHAHRMALMEHFLPLNSSQDLALIDSCFTFKTQLSFILHNTSYAAMKNDYIS